MIIRYSPAKPVGVEVTYCVAGHWLDRYGQGQMDLSITAPAGGGLSEDPATGRGWVSVGRWTVRVAHEGTVIYRAEMDMAHPKSHLQVAVLFARFALEQEGNPFALRIYDWVVDHISPSVQYLRDSWRGDCGVTATRVLMPL